jgi:ribosomal protein S27E
MILAEKTLQAIHDTMLADQGGRFREFLGKVIPHMADAYRGQEDGRRTHLGASMIGRDCARDIWYGFRWATVTKHDPRILRLFNRGHLEEARFIALLLSIGVAVYQQDANGNQFRISDVGGHFGGSGDGVALGIPDVDAGTYCLLEFKTHGVKSFAKLKEGGVQIAKPEHYTQMQIYMRKFGLPVALYGAVCKDTDELHFEIVYLQPMHADQFLDRGRQIVMLREAPKRISEKSSFFKCTFCDHKQTCHHDAPMAVSCRSCYHVKVDVENGGWVCGQSGLVLTKEDQMNACKDYIAL